MSTAEEIFDGVLDLTGADDSAGSFEAIPAGSYQAHVHSALWKATSNPDGKKALPDKTPYLNVQIAIDEDERNGQKTKNRRVFGMVFVPAEGSVPPDKLAYHRGMMVNFLRAVGYTDAEMNKKGFRLDPDELGGRQLTVVVTRQKNDLTDEWDNGVRGYKPAGDVAASGSGLI